MFKFDENNIKTPDKSQNKEYPIFKMNIIDRHGKPMIINSNSSLTDPDSNGSTSNGLPTFDKILRNFLGPQLGMSNINI
jgi:hypothetical protein